MQRLSFVFLAFFAAAAPGCIVVQPGPGPVVTCSPPTFGNSTASYPQVNVYPGLSTSIPAGDIGYLVTANGQGGYRLAWTDTLNSPACFSGIITVQGTVSQVSGLSGQETLQQSGANQLRFASAPGANVDGIDFVASTDPAYFDLFLDGSLSVNIYYTDTATQQVTTAPANPVAFTSP